MNKLFKLDGIPYIILGNILIYGLLILWITVIEPLLKGTGVQFEGFLPTGTLIRGIIAYGCMFLFDLFFAVRSNVRFTVLVWLLGVIVWFVCLMIYTPHDIFYTGYYRDIIGNWHSSSFSDFLANIFEGGTLLYSAVYSVIIMYAVRIIPFIITYIITIFYAKKKVILQSRIKNGLNFKQDYFRKNRRKLWSFGIATILTGSLQAGSW